jgi:hypothetical protein
VHEQQVEVLSSNVLKRQLPVRTMERIANCLLLGRLQATGAIATGPADMRCRAAQAHM